MKRNKIVRWSIFCFITTMLAASSQAKELKVLFLGDKGHHRPKDRFEQLQPVLADRGVSLTYTDNMQDVNLKRLRMFDALLLYANIDRIEPPQEQALLEYVSSGGGFAPLHCATYCFRNSDQVVALMGAQFKRHGGGVFRTEIASNDHPIMKGFGGFESWDETYVHHLHNEENRTVLSYRVDSEGREPWTWVRTHGEGRVFYTAWGHDQRTWSSPGFQNLVERGLRWSAKQPVDVPDYKMELPFPVPKSTPHRTDVKPFEYVDVGKKIPNYTPGKNWGTQSEPLSKMQKPLPPQESIKHYVTPVDFHLELFVSDPQLEGKPICMTWDERGRLWVAETYDYPNELQPVGKGRDRIRICEDTDGDWKADKFTVFADRLSIPTSITFANGGVIVQDSTRTLFMKDTDGDDVADEKTEMFLGWNQRDTHGGVSNFQYGLDNWIWAMQGYNTSRPVSAKDKDAANDELRFAAGFFRFRPDGSEIEFIRSTNNNTWGLGISEEGIIFGSTANRNPSVHMPIPNRYYESVQGWAPSLVLGTIADNHLFAPVTDKVRQVDQHGGYTAGAGHALYTARNYPSEYWNRVAFVNGPTGHLVGTFVLKRDGAGFRSSSPFNLVASHDEWSAPIMSEIGPDGNVWILDWYNYIIQHNPTPRGFENGRGNAYVTELRDKKHGRIYRLVYDKSKPAKAKTLAGASGSELVAALKSDTMLWRKHAQRLLVERGKRDVLSELYALVKDESVDSIGLNVGAIHALHAIHGLGALDGSNRDATAVAVKALAHPSAGVRRNAIQVLPPKESSVGALLASDLLNDSDAQVRLAAVLALADLPASNDAQVGKDLVGVANDPTVRQDRWFRDATIAAAAKNSGAYLTAVGKQTTKPSAETGDMIQIVAEHYARTAPAEGVHALVKSLKVGHPAASSIIVRGLAAGWPADKKPDMNAEFEKDLESLLNRLETGSQGQLLKLASAWGSERLSKFSHKITSDLIKELDDESRSNEQRISTAQRLVDFQSFSADAIEQVLDRITPQMDSQVATKFVNVVRASESPKLGEILAKRLTDLSPNVRKSAIVVMLNRRSATKALLTAIDQGDVQLAELSLDQRTALSRHPDRSVRDSAREILKRGGALPDADRQKVLNDFMPITEVSGDAVAGHLAFKKVCAKCHRHGAEGANVGPDLTGMAVHPKDELLTHILDPNRSVEGNFRIYNLVTNDGLVINGMLASESKTAIELFDAEGKKTSVLRSDIESWSGSKLSLMPVGFEKQLNRKELTDLLEFLTKRGSFHPLDLSEAATIASDTGMFTGGEQLLTEWTVKTMKGVPFELIDPQDSTRKNLILLHGPLGSVSRKMPKTSSVSVGQSAKLIHLLSGVSGWGYPATRQKSVSMIVRLHYANGEREDHELLNGVHFADYIRRVDVPASEFAFRMRGHQMRYLAVSPEKSDKIERIEFVKGKDDSAPIVLAVTIEGALNSH